jgi:hypothetical protein
VWPGWANATLALASVSARIIGVMYLIVLLAFHSRPGMPNVPRDEARAPLPNQANGEDLSAIDADQISSQLQ